jgi:hypothetical protein
MALADGFVFRSVIPLSQIEMVSRLTAVQRIAFFAPRAVLDELIFRLILTSATAWLLVLVVGKPQPWCFWTAILVSAFGFYPATHWAYLASLDPAPLTWLREIALHGGAGFLWGYLYWRHGLAASAIGHVGAHLALQPLLGLLT